MVKFQSVTPHAQMSALQPSNVSIPFTSSGAMNGRVPAPLAHVDANVYLPHTRKWAEEWTHAVLLAMSVRTRASTPFPPHKRMRPRENCPGWVVGGGGGTHLSNSSATPKSDILTSSPFESNRFPGLMSRWITPWEWMYSTPVISCAK